VRIGKQHTPWDDLAEEKLYDREMVKSFDKLATIAKKGASDYQALQ
jgi:hypothetical protein